MSWTREGGGVPGEGTIQDLGAGGCRIFSDTPPSVGDTLRICLHVPTLLAPIIVDRSIVRWLVGREFGAEFLTIGELQLAALAGVLQDLASTCSQPHLAR